MAGKLTKKQKKYLLYAGIGIGALALLALAVRAKNGGTATCPSGQVAFRTNAVGGNYVSGTWIAADINGDGNLEGLGFNTYQELSITYPGRQLYGMTPDGKYIFILSDQVIWISNFDITTTTGGTVSTYVTAFAASEAVLSPYPTEPYTSNGQEVCR